MTTSTAEEAKYVLRTYSALQRIFRCTNGTGRNDDNDIVQQSIIRVLRNLASYMAKYPSPDELAAALSTTARLDYERSERVAKGLGAKLYVTTDGTKVAGRTMTSWDNLAEHAVPADRADHIAAVESRIDSERAIAHHPLRTRQLIHLVHENGYTVTEAAKIVGCSREYASRILSAALAYATAA